MPATSSIGWLLRATVLAPVLWAVVQAQLPGHPSTPTPLLSQRGERGVDPQFERDVFPIFRAHCLKCHGLEGFESHLDLRTVPLIRRGGKNGPVLISGSASESRIYQRVVAREMPPGQELKLTDDQVATIRQWIDAGASANYSDELTAVPVQDAAGDPHPFWAFRKIGQPNTPALQRVDRVRSPVDTFVLAKLAEKGLAFSSDADWLVLLRRAHFDLIGLPPTPEEIGFFLNDTAPDAYERLIDRLLASPHFGERWGRHWLDAAGYVDVQGGDNDAGIIKLSRTRWLYRDYVVQSFNSDKPLERFLLEQLAGDELVEWRSADQFTPEMKELLIATGFLRTAADDTDENELNTADIRHGVLQRTAEVVASNLLALTLNCAKCHDHKYDPISQRDYYQLQAVFAPALNPQSWLQPKQRTLADVSPAELAGIEQHNAVITAQVNELSKQLAELHGPFQRRLFEQKLSSIPEPIRADTKVAIQTAVADRTEIQKYLASKFESSLKVSTEEVVAVLGDAERLANAELVRQVADLNRQRRSWGEIQAVYDVGPPLPTYILRRGNHETPGLEVHAGFLDVLSARDEAGLRGQEPATTDGRCCGQPDGAAHRADSTASSGRRLALARTLTDWSSPAGALVARVQVNRVWQHLFGRGIVETSDNFGQNGASPSHPELLEWLANEFIMDGRQFKPLIKMIMTSTVYRQASSTAGASSESHATSVIDPDNTLLWRQRLRRLESEIIRDSLLAAGGQLDRSFGGPPVPLESRPDGTVIVKEQDPPGGSAQNRRSIYLLARRNYHPTLLAVFDQPALPTNCTARTSSAVVSQSLTMLNDPFVRRQADAFASRIVEAAAESMDAGMGMAFRIALGRDPTPDERVWAAEFLAREVQRGTKATQTGPESALHRAFAALCQTILNASEFLYVE